MRLKQSGSNYPFSPFLVNFCVLVAYSHIYALWSSIRGSVSRNLSVSNPVYISSSIIYAHTARFMIEFYSQSRAACLDDALSVMANQFDDPPTIGVDETIQVPLEEDIADSIPAHSLLTDDEPIDMKPGCKHLLILILFGYT